MLNKMKQRVFYLCKNTKEMQKGIEKLSIKQASNYSKSYGRIIKNGD